MSTSVARIARAAEAAGPHVVGVRHHSPACARLVRETIRRVRPRHVLIEGPCDFNPRLDELRLDHQLPIAVFSYLHSDAFRHAAWAPFCEYSPEWIALETAREVDAEARFCDLPSWHECFRDLRNRYADRRGDDHRRHAESYVDQLCARFSVDDSDSLWDHLFEQPMPTDELGRRLATYFEHLRDHRPPAETDEPRERFMAQAVAWAVADAAPESVVVVCGGYHAPVLARAWREHEPDSDFPSVEPPPGADCHSYLVPYSYKRLDAFAGYQSGMPSPAFYEELWRTGPEVAGSRAVEWVVGRLRAKKQRLSTADLIAADAMTRGLARLRGRTQPCRVDVLDGLAGALLKDGLDAPMPWARRGALMPHTHPLLVEMVKALSGDRRGRLDPRTPQPPLLVNVQQILDELDLSPGERVGAERRVELDLLDPFDRRRSRALHRLAILRIPGFDRLTGPEQAGDVVLHETWRLRRVLHAEVAVIEASSWGPTLAAACAGRLENRLAEAESLGEQADLLTASVFAGLDALAERCLEVVSRCIDREPAFGELGRATRRFFDLWRHDGVFADLRRAALPSLQDVLDRCVDRGLWLLEGLHGGAAPADPLDLEALATLRDVVSKRSTTRSQNAPAVFSRRALDPEAPPAIRGGCLGALWSLQDGSPTPAWSTPSGEPPERLALRGLRTVRRDLLGEFLAGLFALAREASLRSEPLLEALDATLAELEDETFLVALPALRLAFSYFPPLEREVLARFVSARHGDPSAAGVRDLLRVSTSPVDFAAGSRLDARVAEVAQRYGLSDSLDDPAPDASEPGGPGDPETLP